MVKVKISEIKANPFKRFINEGELDSERVEKLVESIEHGTLPNTFQARKNDKDEWEQTCGHHRLAAFKKKYGKDYEVEINKVNFPDEIMLIEMVRENITQRNSDFQDTEASVVLTRTWRQSGATTSKHLGNRYIQKGGKSGLVGSEKQLGSAQDIADFLAKNGKAISIETIRKYLNIHDNLDSELHKKVSNIGWTKATKENKEEHIGQEIAAAIATINKPDQKKVLEQIKHLRYHAAAPIITAYKKADEKSQKLFKEGKINGDELKTMTKEEAEGLDKWETHGRKEYKLTQEQANTNLNRLHTKIGETKEELAKTEMAIELKLLGADQLVPARKALKELATDIYNVDKKMEKVIK